MGISKQNLGKACFVLNKPLDAVFLLVLGVFRYEKREELNLPRNLYLKSKEIGFLHHLKIDEYNMKSQHVIHRLVRHINFLSK